jgi:metal-responsive CopG/Arc/MetJ family transcriptional regulator
MDVREKWITCNLVLTEAQVRELDRRAKRRTSSRSQVARELLAHAMERRGAKDRGEQPETILMEGVR